MSTSAINNSALSSLYGASTQTSASTSTTKNDGLGQTAFLNLLITQLKNQDPLNPMKDTEFIAQLASFSSLEQMTNINTNISNLLAQQNYTNAANMIGKQITASDNSSGIVTKVGIENGTVYVYVGTTKYTLSDITSVSNATA